MIACVQLPALPLQLLLRQHPDWLELPMAVVDREAPTGKVLWVNQRAWQHRIRPGMRYAAALALTVELRAGVVSDRMIEASVSEVCEALSAFSPSVEPSWEPVGLFTVSVDGLGRLYPSMERWALEVESALLERGFRADVVVGFDRFAVSALALARFEERVIASREQERRALARVPLERLALDPSLLEGMHRLGVKTLGALMRLPRTEVSKRFGEPAERLHAQAVAGASVPVQAHRVAPPLEVGRELEYIERSKVRLMGVVQDLLPALVGRLIAQDALLGALELSLTLDRAMGESRSPVLVERLRPSTPTLDEGLILELVRLRLDATPLGGGVVSVAMRATPSRAERVQPGLVEARPRRDVAAGGRALARLEAELGEGAVGRLVVEDGHLPEARIGWAPIERLVLPSPSRRAVLPIVRRVSLPPRVLPPRARHEPDGWMVRGPEDGVVTQSFGPHVLSGAWWRSEIHREYYYLETSRGRLLWVFFDRRRRRWFLQGAVE